MLFIDYGYLQEKEKEEAICFFDGNDYLDLTDAFKVFYVTGLIDMWSYVSHSDIPEIFPIFRRKILNSRS